MSSEEQPNSRKIIHYALKADSALMSLGGIFLLLKDSFMELELLGKTGDMFLGTGLLVVGITTYIIIGKLPILSGINLWISCWFIRMWFL